MDPVAAPVQPTLDDSPSLLDGPTGDSTALGCVKVFVRDLSDGARVESPFVVRDVTRRQKKNGDSFLKLQLGDATGAVEAVVWDEVEAAAQAAEPGTVVVAAGVFSVDARYGACITVRSLRPAGESEYDPADLLDGPSVAYEQMVADLRELVSTVQDPHLRGLLERLLGEESDVWRRWCDAPAAKYYHQAYRHGLLEHCLSVASGVSAVSATFPGIDRDVAVTGALLHDIGKIEAYATQGGAIDLSDAGRLEGEIPLGYYLVRRAIEDMPGFPPATAQALLHIILSHHGQLEHGSPVVPCTREATLVHMIDNLGGRLGSFDRLEKGLSSGARWSGFDRAIAGSAYFAAPRDLGEAA
ncbi:MAG: 3-5 exoribonuclease [Thermoleophilaceae bacterium]|jgi:3'-5' exoribonuclease|nr:3-5 exoribonuclease [Thermoleophilaceae bacterium]